MGHGAILGAEGRPARRTKNLQAFASGFADWRKQNRSFSGELCRCQSGFHHFLCCKTLTLIALRLISTVPTPPENLATWLYYGNVRTVSGPIQAILSSKDMEVRPERDSLAPDLGACELLDRCFLSCYTTEPQQSEKTYVGSRFCLLCLNSSSLNFGQWYHDL